MDRKHVCRDCGDKFLRREVEFTADGNLNYWLCFDCKVVRQASHAITINPPNPLCYGCMISWPKEKLKMWGGSFYCPGCYNIRAKWTPCSNGTRRLLL